MRTIVQYSAEKPPYNGYPKWIVSPIRPGPCCLSCMEPVGMGGHERGLLYDYRRCRRCGYTVRHFAPVGPVEGSLFRILDRLRVTGLDQ